ncbi:MAG: DNA mismatch repair endonuclease MutL [Halolamina sp.]
MSNESDDATEPSIIALSEETVRQIAAGEVVERPASVVKELVENSLDAGADRVSVAVEAGGTEGVRVRDDGDGMTAAELELAVEEHTTSKIADIDDLESGVGTLGFRGEALHTISAVSRTTVRSKPRGDAGAGHELVVEGGDAGEVTPVGCPAGTVVEVTDLFYNTPAREKFLSSETTEFDHVNRVVTQYALANPDVAMSLDHDGREVFATEGSGDLRSAVLAVYGREVAEAMVEVEATDPEGPVESIRGVVSHPETTRAGREYLSTFVNDRYVAANALREGIVEAYGGQLAADRYPFAVLFVEVPPASVDVNVHPRKMEVRFGDEAGVREATETAVRNALLDHGLVRSGAPRGRSAPEETEVRPGADGPAAGAANDEEDAVVGGAGTDHERAAGVDERRDDRTGRTERRDLGDDDSDDDNSDSVATTHRDAESDLDEWQGEDEEPDEPEDEFETETETERESAPGGADDEESFDDWSVEGVGGTDPDAMGSDERSQPRGADPDGTTAGIGETDPDASVRSDATGAGNRGDRAESTVDRGDGERRGPTSQRTLTGDTAEVGGAFDSLPRLRVLGQHRDTYVVAEAPAGLVLIDQHAADERVNYERLRAELDGDVATQALAEPVELTLTAREAELFAAHAEALAAIGFRAERVDDRTVAVEAVPAVFDAALEPDLLRDALSALVAEDRDGDEPVAAVVDDLLADLACYPSVTGNTSLTEGSVAELLAALDDCENPYACPHGRPVVVALDDDEVAERFERDYPGHP